MTAPRVGDIVHYVSYGTPGGEFESVCRAAIITQVSDSTDTESELHLAVVNPTGLFFNRCPYAHQSDKQGGTWHYQCPPEERFS